MKTEILEGEIRSDRTEAAREARVSAAVLEALLNESQAPVLEQLQRISKQLELLMAPPAAVKEPKRIERRELSVPEVSARTDNTHQDTIRRWIRECGLPAKMWRGRYYVLPEDLETFLAAGGAGRKRKRNTSPAEGDGEGDDALSVAAHARQVLEKINRRFPK